MLEGTVNPKSKIQAFLLPVELFINLDSFGVGCLVLEICTKYIHSSTVLKYKFEGLVLYLSIFFLCHFLLLLHYISEGNIVLFTPYFYLASY